MKKFLVIGNPISHSLSPELHNYWIKQNKIDAIYRKKKINDLNLQRVILKDFVTGREKEKIYYSSDLFVLLSHSENFGLSIAEALSYKLPVITSTNTPWRKLNNKKCGWCIKMDSKIIEKTIEKAFLLTSKQRLAMGQKGREWMMRDFSDASKSEVALK